MRTEIKVAERDTSLDAIQGFLIIYMVLWHCFQWTETTETDFYHYMEIFGFFMPWFFYKSGMFFHKSPMKNVLVGGGKKLLIPFVVYSLIGHMITSIKLILSGDTSWIHYVLSPIKQILIYGSSAGNWPLWFLLSLYVVKIVVNTCSNNKQILVMGIISLSVAFLWHYHGNGFPYYFGNIAAGCFFYCMGYLLRDTQYGNILFVTSFVVYLLFCFIGLNIVDMRSNGCNSGIYYYWPIQSVAGIIVINNLFKRTPVNWHVLVNVGRDSMNYYVVHWIVIALVLLLFQLFDIETIGLKTLFLLLGVLIIGLPATNYTIKLIETKYAN